MIKAILAVKDYKGVLGPYSFTPNGDGLHEVSVVPLKFPQISLTRNRLLSILTLPRNDSLSNQRSGDTMTDLACSLTGGCFDAPSSFVWFE